MYENEEEWSGNHVAGYGIMIHAEEFCSINRWARYF